MDEPLSDPHSYIFGRDRKSCIRLNYQHMLIKKLCNDQLLHPTIQLHVSSSSIRIADVATGTACWLTDLSDALPAHAELHGFDISRNQFPPKQWLPENVLLHQHDAFEPFPAEFLDSFDVVNLRFFITLLHGDNIQPLLDNLRTLLKPGGFIQWLDLDPRSAKAITAGPDLAMPRTESVASIMRKAQPRVEKWLLPNAQLLEATELEAVAYDRIKLRDRWRPVWNDCQIMGMEELGHHMSRSGADTREAGPSPMAQSIRELEIEFAQGAGVDAEWFRMVGRLPGPSY